MQRALKKIDIAFVILNYNTGLETIECIESIAKKIDTEKYIIVIVDNCSSDDSVDVIGKKFANNSSKLKIIRMKSNLGFANGNNAGIEYLQENYDSDYIVVLNSDTELLQNDLYKKINDEYNRSRFSVLGPMIVTINGRCDNSPHPIPSVKSIENELKRFRFEKIIIYLGLYRVYALTKQLLFLLKSKLLKMDASHRYLDFSKYQKNVVLQGCFLIFTKESLEIIGGFNKDTFLYYEEPLVYLRLKKNNLLSVYTPEICIYHKDGKAVNTIAKGTRKKLLFINECYRKSAEVVLNELRNMEEINEN